MGFETVILNRVEEILGESHKAGFYNGTLFVETSKNKAQKLYKTLKLHSISFVCLFILSYLSHSIHPSIIIYLIRCIFTSLD